MKLHLCKLILSDGSEQCQHSFGFNVQMTLCLFVDKTDNCIYQIELVAYPKALCTFITNGVQLIIAQRP